MEKKSLKRLCAGSEIMRRDWQGTRTRESEDVCIILSTCIWSVNFFSLLCGCSICILGGLARDFAIECLRDSESGSVVFGQRRACSYHCSPPGSESAGLRQLTAIVPLKL
jgi:hypothetical protein